MRCIVPSRYIHACDCLNYCNYNVTYNYANSSRNSSHQNFFRGEWTPKHIHFCGIVKPHSGAMPLMSQLTAQLCFLNPLHYAVWQCNTSTAALTSSLHHHHYIRSCRTSLGTLLRSEAELLTTLC